ncbi:MAG: TIGR00725 family protein [Nitrospirota bacterium]|nr:TIGR00725 family protein [Nitrospirota bacterium]
MKRVIAVIGGRRVKRGLLLMAEDVGRLIAERGAVLLCGGLGGIMEASAKGAKEAGGLTLGVLPQDDKGHANPFIDVPVATGLGIGRNVIIARTADALVAIGGQYGTLSEIAFSLQLKKPVVGIETWDIDGVIRAETPEDAVRKIFDNL